MDYTTPEGREGLRAPEVQEGRPGALGTLDELLDVLAELEDEVLENIYGIEADSDAPLDVAVLADVSSAAAALSGAQPVEVG